MMMTIQERESSGPGIVTAVLTFALFATIVTGSVLVDRERGDAGGEGFPPGAFRLSPDGSSLEMVTVMRQMRQSSKPGAFRQGKMVTLLGDGALDLTRAQMSGDSGRMEVVVMAGHAQIKVPPEWRVRVDDKVALGRIENRADRSDSASPPTLHLVAVIFGGALEVTH
jgi:hypothetical protein